MVQKKKYIIIGIVLILVAVLSFTVIYKAFSSQEFIQPRVDYLEGKKTTVMEMSGVAIAASAAITVLPGDVGTPIAEKLADLSKYSLVILSAVFLEKYLLNLLALVAFRMVIPIGLLVMAGCLIVGKQRFFRLGFRLALCGVLVFSVIPVSVLVSKNIEATYASTLNQTIETAKEDTQEIQDNSENQTILEKFINSVKGGAKAITEKFEKTLTNMIEAFAVMIVTSVLIPVLVYLLIWWIVRMLLSVEIMPIAIALPDPKPADLTEVPEEPIEVEVEVQNARTNDVC